MSLFCSCITTKKEINTWKEKGTTLFLRWCNTECSLRSLSLILHQLLSCTLESYIMWMRLVGPEILIYLLYKHNASHLLFSLYQSNASHFLFSLDHCNTRLLLFSLVQDCVMATTSWFHYNRTVWCQLPLILLYRRAFE